MARGASDAALSGSVTTGDGKSLDRQNACLGGRFGADELTDFGADRFPRSDFPKVSLLLPFLVCRVQPFSRNGFGQLSAQITIGITKWW